MRTQVVLILAMALWTEPGVADVVSFDGTADSVSGFDIGVGIFDVVQVDIDYDPSADPSVPGGMTFPDAINSLTLTFPDAGIEITGTGTIVNNTSLNNDIASAVDGVSWSMFGGLTGTVLINGETAEGMSAGLTETNLVATPDLLTTDLMLPIPPFDLMSEGTIVLAMGLTLTNGNFVSILATNYIQTVPEPSSRLGTSVALLAIAWYLPVVRKASLYRLSA